MKREPGRTAANWGDRTSSYDKHAGMPFDLSLHIDTTWLSFLKEPLIDVM